MTVESQSNTMIQLNHISRVFNQDQVNEVRALKEVTLHIKRGEFVSLIGSNGSGKTTLMNVISGAVLPSAGQVFLHGEDATRLPEHKRSKWIARVFQNPLGGTAPDLSILDNFRLAALRTSKKQLKIGITGAFKEKVSARIADLGLGLEDKVRQPMGTLSGGQRQALTLLMSTMDHTDILLLDEPTAALDPRSAEVVLETAQKIITTYNLTTVFITHKLENALKYGNRLIQMKNGKIVRDLDAEAKKALQLQEVYEWFG